VPDAPPQARVIEDTPEAKPRTEAAPAGPAVRSWADLFVPEGLNELERLAHVPGLVGDAVDWMMRSAIRPNRMMALGSALVVVGTITGRHIQGPTDSSTHLSLQIIAGSGRGKDHPLKCGKILLRAVGLAGSIGPDEFVSSAGLVKRLKRELLLACFVDELGDELEKIKSQSGNYAVASLFGLFKKLYNAFEIQDTAEYAAEGKESESLYWPALSIIGAGTPQAVFGAIEGRDVESGFMNRFLVLPYEGVKRRPEQLVPDGARTPPAELIAGLKRLPRQRAASAADILNGPVKKRDDGKLVLTGLEPKLAPRMAWGPGAEEAYTAYSARIDALEDTNARRFDLSLRGAENAVRLATIVAVG
jgi:hypothetical protein